MTKDELISSGLLESYVLGTSSNEENTLIQSLCKQHPELLAEIESIEQQLMQLSSRAGHTLNKALKEKIASDLTFREEAAVMPLSQPKPETIKFYRFALAASLLLFVTSFTYNLILHNKLGSANAILATLITDKDQIIGEMQSQQAMLTTISHQFRIVADPGVKTVGLKGMNYLAKKTAAVHWNTQTNEVYFDASQLPSVPAEKQYQLWAIVDGKPIDIGVIDPSSTGTIFQKMKTVKGAQAFAVTIEQVGGSPVPTMETMCLLGNV